MKFLVYFLLPIIVSCTLLTDMAMNAVSGEKGGINTELVVGDKEQVLGSNIEVKADEVGKVVGTSDNSILAPGAKQVEVTNNTFPVWGVVALVGLAGLVGYLAPRPQAWKRLIGSKTNGD